MNYLKMILFVTGFLVATNVSSQSKDSAVSFKVSGLCGLCKERIEKAVKAKGVNSATWSAATQVLQLSYKPDIISLESVHKKIASVGHDTELKKATDNAYNLLPDCCLYRNTSHAHSEMQDDSLSVSGIIVHEDSKGNLSPLTGANISWLDDHLMKTSDNHGVFSIPLSATSSRLVVSYTGFTPDTIDITQPRILQVV